ncbi:MAG TPA: heparin lyase I family protein [Longimicrobiaceae bacterium]|nr:heparin lyase I family protein [Longimicrobiaceae bacterium]
MVLRRMAAKWILVAAPAALAPACGDAATAPAAEDALHLSVTAATLEPGESLRIQVSAGAPAAWESSAPAVASVSRDGVVTAVREGEAAITAVRGSRRATARVRVDDAGAGPGLLFEDGFEAAEVTRGQNGFAWKGGAYVSTSTERARSGSRALKFRFGDLGTTRVTEQSRAQLNFTFPAMTEVWLQWYAYYPDGMEGIPGVGAYEHGTATPDNNKLLRIYADGHYSKAPEWGATTSGEGAGAGGASKLRIDHFAPTDNWTPKRRADAPYLVDLTTDRGRWVQIRFHGKKATPGMADGLIRFWKDGVLAAEATGLALYDPTGAHDHFSAGYLYGAANSGFPRETAVYVDDFRIHRADPGW